ncbi:DNA polymerase II large subunit [Candidatus Woesearchaeota archaeon]|nr:DNA polymerase II large subunit [Candidatus Woesearchaeota archaeon]
MAKENKYTTDIMRKVEHAYAMANKARLLGYDPEDSVNIPLAKNMAERVEGLVSVAAPQIMNSGIPARIKELESIYGKLDWRVALTISLETSQQKFCKFETEKEAIETGIRVGLAYSTLGVVASPLEGFVGLKIRRRLDGGEYFALMYSGPIRSAGGTAGALSIVIADYIRKNMGYSTYDPTEKEAKRMVTELYDYHERITNLQYLPTEKEILFLVSNLPVQIDGDASEDLEVSNHKDLDRIETNRIRSGPCLVVGECIAQKAAKVWIQLKKWGGNFGLEHWAFLQDFVHLQKETRAKQKTSKKGIMPIYTYIEDLVSGRPVLTHPLSVGGFRLRYGRCRTSGYSATAIHPATMIILDNYIAIGTQLKVERPGKATAVTVCDSIEGPIVKLNDNSVVRIDTEQKAKEFVSSVKEILFLGDILISYGDFFNRGHTLVPAGYCEEWWALEVERAATNLFGSLDYHKLSQLTNINKDHLEKLTKECLTERPDPATALMISQKLEVPLHPYYTYHWKTILREDFLELLKWFASARVEFDGSSANKIVLPRNEVGKRVLELTGAPHIFVNNEYTIIEKEDAEIFFVLLKLGENDFCEQYKAIESEDALGMINSVSKIKIRDKSGIFIGARMGRPEKGKVRKLDGNPHTLFPVGKEGGKTRAFQSAIELGYIEAEFPIRFCAKCKKETIFSVCEQCDAKTKKMGHCSSCGTVQDAKCRHGEVPQYKTQRIDINSYFKNVLKKLNMQQYPDLIKGVRGTSSKNHIPEHFAKGILRAKYDLPVNRDGTTRYDMTQLPITNFKPKEIGTSIDELKNMGYTHDINDLELSDPDQVLEMMPQDIILPKCEDAPEIGADKILYNVGIFIDELLALLYKQKKFYKFGTEKDLTGHLVVALAPHTSAGIVGRIIGFSKTQAFYAHPLFHAATRRDCDGDEASVTLLMDALLNFSRQFLPDSRGSTQDAPLVLTSILVPTEVDDMIFDLDVMPRYPIEFYEATQEYMSPSAVKVDRFLNILDSENQYAKIFYTHPVSNINGGVRCSSYKILPSMEDKLKGQMELAEKIRAVDAADVARLVIEKHLLRDIRGNLRKFSQQQFRCSKCTEKYRRPPLTGKCLACGSRLIFTVTEGAIIKYLEPAISLSEKYNVPPYLKQTLLLTKDRVEGLFGREKDKQEGLGRWFG